MPTTRRSTGRTGPTKGQSTISFANRVTKAIPQDTKKAILSEPVKKIDTPQRPAKEAKAEEIVTVEPEEESEEEVVEEEVVEEVAVPEKTESELEAEKISDAQINKYWKGIEKERIAPRVHQKDLSVGEKVLRYFDVSSQYGPCIGTPRMKRWQRAQRLGLSPPIEVLAVLLKAESKNDKEAETAQMDKILNATV